MAINKIIYDVSGEQIVDQNGQVTVYGIDGHGHTVNKVEYGQSVLMDITDTTATASDVAFGEYFYSNDGIKRTGTKSDASPINVNPSAISVSSETATMTVTSANLDAKTVTANGTYNASSDNLDGYSSVTVNVASKNVQIANGVNRVNTTEYTAVSGQTLTVAETGKYDVYWSGYRSSTSGTSGSQLYIDDTAYDSANTTFSNNGQSVHLSNVSLTKNQVIAVRARARNTSSYMYVSNLTIVQN